MTTELTGKVAIITGAGNGLGKNHALHLAKQGAYVVVNDLGGQRDGLGSDSSVAESVCNEIRMAGGTAIAHSGSVTDVSAMTEMVELAIETWGRVDILVNNAGILRDKSFAKMSLEDFSQVLDVHLMGSVICTKLVYPHMQKQKYGRIVMTTSSSGLYGNFGQTNYGAAKLGLVGFMNSLGLESIKYNIRVNALSPIANTRMTEDLIPGAVAKALDLNSVTAGLLTLCLDDAPNRTILAAGASYYAIPKIVESAGKKILDCVAQPKQLLKQLGAIGRVFSDSNIHDGQQQTVKFITAEKPVARTMANLLTVANRVIKRHLK